MLLAAIIFFFLPPSFLECHSLWREQNREGTYAKTSRVRMATGLFNFLFFSLRFHFAESENWEVPKGQLCLQCRIFVLLCPEYSRAWSSFFLYCGDQVVQNVWKTCKIKMTSKTSPVAKGSFCCREGKSSIFGPSPLLLFLVVATKV
ncbi:unnamed protein product [Ixodes pacificus]